MIEGIFHQNSGSQLKKTKIVHLFSTMLTENIIYTSYVFAYTGASESWPDVVHSTKPQRPTSLPIQPFVLQPPSGKNSSKALSSQINHYITHKNSACKITDLSRCLSHSPLDSYSSIHLEIASCSDTCSTCTPTPTEPHAWPHWAPCPPLFQTHSDLKYKNTQTIEPKLPDNNPGADHSFLDQITPCIKSCMTDQEKTAFKSFPNKHLESFLSEQRVSHQTPSECLAPELGMQEEHDFSHHNWPPALTSMTSHTSHVLPGSGQSNSDTRFQAHTDEELSTAAPHIFGPKKLSCMILLPFLMTSV